MVATGTGTGTGDWGLGTGTGPGPGHHWHLYGTVASDRLQQHTRTSSSR